MGPRGFDQRFMYMPAVVLEQATPEPSTIVLALCGLLGMLATLGGGGNRRSIDDNLVWRSGDLPVARMRSGGLPG